MNPSCCLNNYYSIANECMMCLLHCISQIVWFTWLIELLVQMQKNSESFKMTPPASTLITRCRTSLDFSNRPLLLSSVFLFTLLLSRRWMVTEEHILWRGCHYYDYGYNDLFLLSNNTEGISFAHLSLSHADAWRRKRLALTWHC